MPTSAINPIILRSEKTEPLTIEEMDNNLLEIKRLGANNQKLLDLQDIPTEFPSTFTYSIVIGKLNIGLGTSSGNIMSGSENTISDVTNVNVSGSSNNVSFASNAIVKGSQNILNHSLASYVAGSGNNLTDFNYSYCNGIDNISSGLDCCIISGNYHKLQNVSNSLIIGESVSLKDKNGIICQFNQGVLQKESFVNSFAFNSVSNPHCEIDYVLNKNTNIVQIDFSVFDTVALTMLQKRYYLQLSSSTTDTYEGMTFHNNLGYTVTVNFSLSAENKIVADLSISDASKIIYVIFDSVAFTTYSDFVV